MNESALIVAQNVSKRFAGVFRTGLEVLHGVNLTVMPGERIAIVGKSGAGKSTFLHILGTLERPTHGQVFHAGKNIFDLNERALSYFRNHEIGFVFQFHYLMLEFNALENVMMPGLLAGQPKKKARERAMHLLSRVGLQERLSHKPAQLSGGEQQRVAVARALMMGPKLLLTDEMTGNLDAATGQQVLELVYEMHSENGTALVSVTHDEGLASTYDRVYRLKDGILE
ncbi:MAG: ABC transporter ATP-binding protein [Deltaproteobacteria bacterium]|nr:ABC transporter ATP-binding protein [Deltaproteobacteria bacterium]